MPIPSDLGELTALFKELGAPDAEQWAASEVAEGIPQLLRFLFLKNAWSNVAEEGKHQWITEAIDRARKFPQEPYAGLGIALASCKAKGVTSEELTDIARCLQAAMLFRLAYLVDGPPDRGPLEDLGWGLFQVDENGKPFGKQIGGLHESVLDTDPTGREMRPRSP